MVSEATTFPLPQVSVELFQLLTCGLFTKFPNLIVSRRLLLTTAEFVVFGNLDDARATLITTRCPLLDPLSFQFDLFVYGIKTITLKFSRERMEETRAYKYPRVSLIYPPSCVLAKNSRSRSFNSIESLEQVDQRSSKTGGKIEGDVVEAEDASLRANALIRVYRVKHTS